MAIPSGQTGRSRARAIVSQLNHLNNMLYDGSRSCLAIAIDGGHALRSLSPFAITGHGPTFLHANHDTNEARLNAR